MNLFGAHLVPSGACLLSCSCLHFRMFFLTESAGIHERALSGRLLRRCVSRSDRLYGSWFDPVDPHGDSLPSRFRSDRPDGEWPAWAVPANPDGDSLPTRRPMIEAFDSEDGVTMRRDVVFDPLRTFFVQLLRSFVFALSVVFPVLNNSVFRIAGCLSCEQHQLCVLFHG